MLRYAKLSKKRENIKNKEKKLSVFLAKEPQQCCSRGVVTLLPFVKVGTESYKVVVK